MPKGGTPKSKGGGSHRPRPPSAKKSTPGRPTAIRREKEAREGGGGGVASGAAAHAASHSKSGQALMNGEIRILQPGVQKSGFTPPSPRGMAKFMKLYCLDQDDGARALGIAPSTYPPLIVDGDG
jgi:hypothetical protein